MIAGVNEFESLVLAGTPLSRSQAETLLSSPDLVGVGTLGESARREVTGDRVTYGRVCTLDGSPANSKAPRGEAGEVRLMSAPASGDEACALVRDAAAFAGDVCLTGFSLGHLLGLVGSDHLALAELARALREAGLEAVAEAPLDGLGDTDNTIEVIRAVHHGGLAVWRATVGAASIEQRLDLIERVIIAQRETSAFKAFAPLPRFDPAETPATGYDDVRTIAIARLMCRSIPLIQVDWPLYGPKLAQVAVAYGANDIDGIASVDPGLGARRSPKEEIERQIRAVTAVPVERNGRFDAIS